MQDDISQAAEPQTATRHTGTTTRPSLLAERTSPRRTIPSKSLVRACTACRRMKVMNLVSVFTVTASLELHKKQVGWLHHVVYLLKVQCYLS